MQRPQRIVLVGLSGTGKSVVARLVARRLGWMSGDTDDQIVSLDGREIAQIFRDEGEAYFRKVERQAVSQLSKGSRWVVATGGGAVLDPLNRERLWRDSFVVYLDTSTDTLLARITRGNPRRAAARRVTTRPLLAGDDPAAALERLRHERAPLYALADHTVLTDDLTTPDVAGAIVRAWERDSAACLADPTRIERVGQDRTSPPAPLQLRWRGESDSDATPDPQPAVTWPPRPDKAPLSSGAGEGPGVRFPSS